MAPSWFDRLNQPAAVPVAPVAPTGTDRARVGSETAGPGKAEPQQAEQAADTSAAGVTDADTDDDDWPTRYSWLVDDDTDEAAEAGQPADSAETDVADVAETVPDEATAAEPARSGLA